MFANLKALVSSFLSLAKDDAIVDFLPLVATAAVQIAAAAATNNKLGVVAAATNLQVQALAKLPTFEAQIATALAAYVQAETATAVAAANADLTKQAGLTLAGATV